MKTRGRVMLVLVALAAGLLLFAVPALAQATTTTFTLQETCPPESQWQFEKITFPDGNLHIRGASFDCQDVGTIPEATGTNHIVLNANFDANGLGPMWGTIRLVTSVGTWDGTWTGQITANGSVIQGISQGSGGLEGQKLFLFGQNGQFTGYVLNPKGE